MSKRSFGAYVKARLHDLGMTQADLADCCNVTQSHISNVLNGRASARKLRPVIISVLDQWEAQRKERRRRHQP